MSQKFLVIPSQSFKDVRSPKFISENRLCSYNYLVNQLVDQNEIGS